MSRVGVAGSEDLPLGEDLQRDAVQAEGAILGDNATDECTAWLQLERERSLCWWLPHRDGDADDADRCVPFQQIQPALITLHAPRNLQVDTGGPSEAQIASVAKQRLLLLFFDHFGLWSTRLSLGNALSVDRVRWQQLQALAALRIIVEPVVTERRLGRRFLRCCLGQLGSVAIGDNIGIGELLAALRLELSGREAIDTAGGWKMTLKTVRAGAKAVLMEHSNNALLWADYGQMLLALVDDAPFGHDAAARAALLAETDKVVQPLVAAAGAVASQVLAIALVMKRSPDRCGDTEVAAIADALARAARSMVAMHQVEVDDRLSGIGGIVDAFTAVVRAATFSEADSVSGNAARHWHEAVYYQAVAQALFYCHYLEVVFIGYNDHY